MNMNFLADLISRLRKDRPQFFKTLQVAAVFVAALSGALAYICAELPILPAWVGTVAKYAATFSSSVFLTAFLPNKDLNQK